MASIKISDLTPITSASASDVLIINDDGDNTRKITFADLTQGFVPLAGDSAITGNVTLTGSLNTTASGTLGGILTIDSATSRIGINDVAPAYTLDIAGTGIQIQGARPIRLADTDNSNFISFQAASVLASSISYVLPSEAPSSDGFVLASTTGGSMSWVANGGGSGAPGGSTSYVQYNDTGGFAGNAALTFDDTTGLLSSTLLRGDVFNADGNTTFYAGDSVGNITLNATSDLNGIGIRHPGVASAYSLTLPADAGVAGESLTTDGTGVLSWAPSLTNPMTGEGDLISSGAGGAPALVALGTTGQVLTVNGAGTGPEWADNTALANPMTTEGDLIVGGVSGLPSRLPLGTADQVLSVNSAGTSLEWAAGGGGGSEHVVNPVVVAVDPDPVDQGQLWTAVQEVDSDLVGLTWSFYDYTGPGATNRASLNGTVGGIENTPGTYTIKGRAAWPFGMSDEITINVIVNAFTLNRDSMFGNLNGLIAWYNVSGTDFNDYLAFAGAVVDAGSGTYTFDVDGSIDSEAASCIAFYSYTADRLIAFRINSSSAIEGVYHWSNVTTLPSQGVVMPNSGSLWLFDSTLNTAAQASSVFGKKVPLGAFYNGGFGSTHYLSMVPSATEFDGFGSRNTDWSFGFRLTDDWLGNAWFNQLLAPATAAQGYFVNTVTGYGIGSSPLEYVGYGDHDNGPFTSSSNNASWNIQSTGWKIGNAGDLVVVTFDGTGFDNYKVYVEGTLIFSNTGVDSYMGTDNVVTELRFGDPGPSNQTAQGASRDALSGWYSRLDYLFVANGTAFDQAQVTELTSSKEDLTGSANYIDITTLGTFDESGVTNTKGTITYSRGDVDFGGAARAFGPM